MRVAILGGYGVFGSRLAELLLRDGHQVWIVGRNPDKARNTAERLRCESICLDFKTDPKPVFDIKPDVLIDAAGPFQSYTADPYRIPRICVDTGTDYLDLSDDADFTAGIAALDPLAQQAGCRLLSGASSVPGLSSVIVADLAKDLEDIYLIDIAILPGNWAPRGTSVMRAILGQAGRPNLAWRGGQWRDTSGWSDKRRIELASDLRRSAFGIEVPDTKLFPAHFGARSVVFRAGMELWVLNAGLSAIARLRRLWPFEIKPGLVKLLQRLANFLLPFGTDRGGMRVRAIGDIEGSTVRRDWRLIAEAGDGPYVPAVTIRAVLRRLDDVPCGARPCLAELTTADISQAMTDLSVTTDIQDAPAPSLFQKALADSWALLPSSTRALHKVHDVESFSGQARVTRGTGVIARLAAALFGFPAEADNVPISVTKMRKGDAEIWQRNFDGRHFSSQMTASTLPGHMCERFWPFTFELALDVKDGQIHLPVRRGWCLGIPVPKALLPVSISREYDLDGLFHFDVTLNAPLGGGLIVRYRGNLTPEGASATQAPQPADPS
ncbi:MAG: DUF4166 domain-containing protein [Pseudomonadota bacterium]